jgi:hypothetical protein
MYSENPMYTYERMRTGSLFQYTISILRVLRILSRLCSDYIRRVLDWQLDLLDHTQLHTITVYTLLQLLTVHYNTCRVFTLYLHWLPVFQYSRIPSPATLQLFSEDCCSVRILTRNSTELSRKQASSSLLLAFASMVILGVEPHRDAWPYFCSHI